ncbi:MAG: hypothetical protein Q9M39_00135 [Sulfurovum sp.]|nr:hypothetical protein [Sulfurovum sp.]
MVKPIVWAVLLVFVTSTHLYAEDVYECNCVECHRELPTSLQRMFMRYLLVYGGEKNLKAGLKHYLKYPLREISVMSELFLDNYAIKKKTTLTNEEIDEALDIYWEKFKVIGRLK